MQKKATKILRRLQTRLHNGWILDNLPKLNEAELKVYIVLAMHANWKHGYSYPRFEKIAQESGLTYGKKNLPNIRRIRQAIHGLEQKGLIKVEFRRSKDKDGKEYGRNRYFYWLKYPSDREYIKD